MRIADNRREGFALAAAIAAIVVIGGLIAGAFFASTQDYRQGRNTLASQAAFATAELGLNAGLTAWSTDTALALPVGTVRTTKVLPAGAPAGDSARLRVTKLNPLTFWLVSDGWSKTGGSDYHARTNTIVRLSLMTFNTEGGLVAKGAVSVGGNSKINGNGVAPTNWDCNGIENKNTAGVATADTTKVTTSGSGTITGQPPKTQSSKAGSDDTYSNFGTTSFDSLAAKADIKLTNLTNISPAPLVSADGKSCVEKDPYTGAAIQTNWGDPVKDGGPCEPYFPTIYAPGSLQIQTGKGQGILLVNGDMTITGNFEFFGIVVIKGVLSLKGTGQSEGKITGVVLAQGADLGEKNELLGNANIQYSNCAVQKALQGNAQVSRAPQRAWAELF